MARTRRSLSSHRKLDLVSEGLISVLTCESSFGFEELFALLHSNLQRIKAVHGGQDMLRLRAYEKLQLLVKKGAVTKAMDGHRKVYRGIASVLRSIQTASDAEGPSFLRK
jgi:hypothetical protein